MANSNTPNSIRHPLVMPERLPQEDASYKRAAIDL
jgi:hypothetical protein